MGDLVYFKAIDEEKSVFSNIHYFKEGIGVIVGRSPGGSMMVWSHKYGVIDALIIGTISSAKNKSIQTLKHN